MRFRDLLFFLFVIGSSLLLANLHAQDQQSAQPNPQASAPHSQGVVSTGVAHPAVLDAEHRPITAGGFVDQGPLVFQDVTAKSGLSTWRHVMGTPEKQY